TISKATVVTATAATDAMAETARPEPGDRDDTADRNDIRPPKPTPIRAGTVPEPGSLANLRRGAGDTRDVGNPDWQGLPAYIRCASRVKESDHENCNRVRPADCRRRRRCGADVERGHVERRPVKSEQPICAAACAAERNVRAGLPNHQSEPGAARQE